MSALLFYCEYALLIEDRLGIGRGGARLPELETCRGVHVHRVSLPPFSTDYIEAFVCWVDATNADMEGLADALGDGLGFATCAASRLARGSVPPSRPLAAQADRGS